MSAKLAFILFVVLTFTSCQTTKDNYVCKPCDLKCDNLTFTEAGTCPHCNMALVKAGGQNEEKKLRVNQIEFREGSGAFLINGGIGNEDKRIKVFYHKPGNFSPTSRILIVIPGAGRNADSYRDAWIESAEKYGVLILSPMYSESEYEFEGYHLGGLITRSNLQNSIAPIENTNVVRLDETRFQFTTNPNPEQWIFNDLDRIFDLTVKTLGMNQASYDVFGHSAGGHILHRLAIFQASSKANRILASNASFYTVPSFEDRFPFGLRNAPITQESLKNAFQKKLVVFLGQLDNEKETGGTFLRSTSADRQGLYRLQRGKYFFEQSKAIAKKLALDFNWKLVIIPNVGHNFRKMGDAAANYLYRGTE